MRSSSYVAVDDRNMFDLCRCSHMTSAGCVPQSTDRSDWSSLEGRSDNMIPANVQYEQYTTLHMLYIETQSDTAVTYVMCLKVTERVNER